MKHFVYKCKVSIPVPPCGLTILITVYSCRDFYVKYPWDKRALRVTKGYLRNMFPHWYYKCGLFTGLHTIERG